jgi:glucoamylase
MVTTAVPVLQYSKVQTLSRTLAAPQAAPSVDFSRFSLQMLALMLRNVSSDGFVFVDPLSPTSFSARGCIIASPSYPLNLGSIDQDYVFNWTRDAAITAIELAAANLPARPGETGPQQLVDYVTFASLCQSNATPTLGHAAYTIEGRSRPNWTEQSDGPAIQTLAILQAYPQLDAGTQTVARDVIAKNLVYLLNEYPNETFNLWEEHRGNSFFARSVQLRCFQAIGSNSFGIPAPSGVAAAITSLQNALKSHWNGAYYVSILPQSNAGFGYDPNIDIVMASIYGAVPVTDTQLLATAAQLRRQWADSSSNVFYPINGDDQARGIGPLLGRYPGDTYDGDVSHPVPGGHPWPVCTCNFAELYYQLANAITSSNAIPFDNLSAPFFAQIGVTAATSAQQAVTALRDAGDRMLQAVIFHSDHLELSEQFDGFSGYEKSVADLTWSYAAFLSAIRARGSLF